MQRLEDRFVAQVEAVRAGMVTAQDRKALSRWQSRVASGAKRKAGLSGADLESAVMRIGELFPGHVIHQAAA